MPKKPLQQRRVTRRARQFPEGTYDPQLMVPTMRFQCLRCGHFMNVVWSDERRKYVQAHGGLPCPKCDEADKNKTAEQAAQSTKKKAAAKKKSSRKKSAAKTKKSSKKTKSSG